MPKPKHTFSTVAHTAPTAEDNRSHSQEPKRPIIQSPPQTSKNHRIAFTWRQTLEQAEQLNNLTRRISRQLGRHRLDKASVLLALIQLADEHDDLRAAVLDLLIAKDV